MINDAALDALFRTARTQNAWTGTEISDDQLRALYDLTKMGPTSANCSPARFVFVRSAEGKEKLRSALSSGNLEKTLSAPVVAIVAYDKEFHKKLPDLFPHSPDAQYWFTSSEQLAYETAFRNGTLQGAYLIMAARAMGIGTGPMSGFDNAKVDEAFFAGTQWKSNFLVNLGEGEPSVVFDRSPRLTFEDACTLA